MPSSRPRAIPRMLAGPNCQHAQRPTGLPARTGGLCAAHPSGWSSNAALWAEMRYPVHGRPPTFTELGNGVIVGVKVAPVICPIASRGLSSRVHKSLTVQGFLAEREGFEPSIRVTPDTACPGLRSGVQAREHPGT